MKTAHRITRGFTLVEIMIVVAIIGLLVAIALPNFLKARKKSMVKAAQSSMKEIQGAVERARLDGVNFANWQVATVSNGVVPDYIKPWPQCPGGGSWNTAGLSNGTMTCTISDINGGSPFSCFDNIDE